MIVDLSQFEIGDLGVGEVLQIDHVLTLTPC